MDIQLTNNLVHKINQSFSILLDQGDARFFEETSIEQPKPGNEELYFLRLVSFIYCLYFEFGKHGINTIKSMSDFKTNTQYKSHIDLIRKLRTWMHHNLKLSDSKRDLLILSDCSEWMNSKTGCLLPNKDEHWIQCSNALISDCNSFLEFILNCFSKIKSDHSICNFFIDNWTKSKDPINSPHVYDEIIQRFIPPAPTDLDIVKFRNRHLDKWKKHIESLTTGYSFDQEAEKIVQSAIIQEFYAYIPISISKLNSEFILNIDLINYITNHFLLPANGKNFEESEFIKGLKVEFPSLVRNSL